MSSNFIDPAKIGQPAPKSRKHKRSATGELVSSFIAVITAEDHRPHRRISARKDGRRW
jgi:hypothetical protein